MKSRAIIEDSDVDMEADLGVETNDVDMEDADANVDDQGKCFT